MSPVTPLVLHPAVALDLDRDAGWQASVEAIRRSNPVAVADDLIASGRLSARELNRLALPRTTLNRRRKIGHLTAEQSDRLSRIVRVLSAVERTFGSHAKAAAWLRRPVSALSGSAPLDLLDTTLGSDEVWRLLGRIDHGIAA